MLSPLSKNGKYYEFLLPSRKNNVSVRHMTGYEENAWGKFLQNDPITPFFDIIDACTDTKNDFRKMELSDFYFILFIIRRLTYGDLFTFDITCPSCNEVSSWTEDLSTTEIIYSSDTEKDILCGNGLFNFYLHDEAVDIQYRLPKAYDHVLGKKFLTTDKNKVMTERRKILIQSVNNKPVPKMFVENLSGFDLVTFDADSDSHSFGVEVDIKPSCNNCGHEFLMQLPLNGTGFLVQPRNLKLLANGQKTTLHTLVAT
jgi:hypothetical protein